MEFSPSIQKLPWVWFAWSVWVRLEFVVLTFTVVSPYKGHRQIEAGQDAAVLLIPSLRQQIFRGEPDGITSLWKKYVVPSWKCASLKLFTSVVVTKLLINSPDSTQKEKMGWNLGVGGKSTCVKLFSIFIFFITTIYVREMNSQILLCEGRLLQLFLYYCCPFKGSEHTSFQHFCPCFLEGKSLS